MVNTMRVHARMAKNAVDFVPSILANRGVLGMDVRFEGASAIPAADVLAVKARDIFSGAEVMAKRPKRSMPQPEMDGWISLDFPPEELPLGPGLWHILVDCEQDGRSLAGPWKGSFAVYARSPGESVQHARASYNLGRAQFAYDRKYGLHYKFYKSELPGAGDPFDDAIDDAFHNAYGCHRTGVATRRRAGLPLRRPCVSCPRRDAAGTLLRRVMKIAARVIAEMMDDGTGKLHYILGRDEERQRGKYTPNIRQQAGFALKYLCQVYFYFTKGPGNEPDYAGWVFEQATRIFETILTDPLHPGCGHNCAVYDGRILAGLGWYARAHHAAKGELPAQEKVDKILTCAGGFAQHLFANEGWYDRNCHAEHSIHGWCGNMNLINGLGPVQRLIRAHGQGGDALRDAVDRALAEAFRFLTQTSGAVTQQPSFVPTAVSQWAGGNMYEICAEYLRLAGEDAGVRLLMEHLVKGGGAEIVDCFHRNNMSGAVILSCPEYQDLDPVPALPWDR